MDNLENKISTIANNIEKIAGKALDISDGKLLEIPTDIFPPILDKILGLPTIFTLIVLFQGCFGGMGILETPEILTKLSENPFVRFFFLTAIAYTATADLEVALVVTIIFFIILHLLRSKDERKKMKSFI